METSAHNLTHDWIVSAEELDAIEIVNAEEMAGNAAELRAREYAYETARNEEAEAFCFEAQEKAFNAPAQKKLFKMRVQQIQILEIEVEGLNANEAQERALKMISNCPEMAELIRTDLGNSTIEEL